MTFDPARAFHDLETLCRIGPRPSGSEGMLRQRKLLLDHFAARAERVVAQSFEAEVSGFEQPVPMANLVASWNVGQSERLLVAAHYDTRPIEGFIGANDGGSGVAVLMELARLDWGSLRSGIDLVAFDGEECVVDPELDGELLGSSHFAQIYINDHSRRKYQGAIILDMVAGKSARFEREASSYLRAFELQAEVWNLAEKLGCGAFSWDVGLDVVDDHIPLLDAGIPAIDLIDTRYPAWHTLADTVEQCSIETIGQVGRLVEGWLRLPRGESRGGGA